MEIKKLSDPAFRKYGRVLTHVDFSSLIEKMALTPLPDGVAYEPSIDYLEATETYKQVASVIYAEMPIEIGYCNGHNSKLNAVEYHRDSEINVAATDAILIVGMLQDVEDDFTYDTSRMEAFLVPAGTAVEVYATTLHYAPCGVDGAGFKVAIILPKYTNYPLKDKHVRVEAGKAANEDALLAAVNKWLIAHPEGGCDDTAYLGLKGKNLDVTE